MVAVFIGGGRKSWTTKMIYSTIISGFDAMAYDAGLSAKQSFMN